LAQRKKIDLRKTLFLLPNIITLSSIFCGFDSIRLSATAQGDEDYYRASVLLVFALFFDMLDGRVARLTKTQSAFGLQIDSLADVISFGVAPGLLVYKWSLYQKPTAGLIAAFLFAGAGAVRLARFNVLSMGESGKPTKPGKYIVGLPVPGAAGILVSLVLANHAVTGELSGSRCS
jgi:CDP-diacylglycerol--serine O-phosphatidyltransferase